MINADDLKNWDTTTNIDEKWVLARPMPFFGLYGLKSRIKDAYAVLTGKADAIKWYKQ